MALQAPQASQAAFLRLLHAAAHALGPGAETRALAAALVGMLPSVPTTPRPAPPPTRARRLMRVGMVRWQPRRRAQSGRFSRRCGGSRVARRCRQPPGCSRAPPVCPEAGPSRGPRLRRVLARRPPPPPRRRPRPAPRRRRSPKSSSSFMCGPGPSGPSPPPPPPPSRTNWTRFVPPSVLIGHVSAPRAPGPRASSPLHPTQSRRSAPTGAHGYDCFCALLPLARTQGAATFSRERVPNH